MENETQQAIISIIEESGRKYSKATPMEKNAAYLIWLLLELQSKYGEEFSGVFFKLYSDFEAAMRKEDAREP